MEAAKRSSRPAQPILGRPAPAPTSRRRQSSLSSQLTFDSDDTGASSDAGTSLPRPSQIFRRHKSSLFGSPETELAEELSESTGSTAPLPAPTPVAVPPSHRLSTTPLFPSPLAQALYDEDSIDLLDIEHTPANAALDSDRPDSESSEADDEADSAATSPKRIPIPSRSGSRSPVRTLHRVRTRSRTREGSSQSDVVSPSSSSSVSSSPPAQPKIEYVPSSSYVGSSHLSSPSTMARELTKENVLSTEKLHLRKSYHEKQQMDSVRSLDFVAQRSGSISGLPPGPALHHAITSPPDMDSSSFARRGSLSSVQSTSPTHSRVGSLASIGMEGSPPTSAGMRPSLVTASSTPVLPATLATASDTSGRPEAIKLQRVPTQVRIAQSLHPLVMGCAAAPAAPLTVGAPSELDVSPPEWANPATPAASLMGSRTGSRSASGSGTVSEHSSPRPKYLHLDRPPSMTSKPQVSVVTNPSVVGSPSSNTSSAAPSAYSPLFDIPSLPPRSDLGSPSTSHSSPTARNRARTVSIASEAGSSGHLPTRPGKNMSSTLSISPNTMPSSFNMPSSLLSAVDKPRSASSSLVLGRHNSMLDSPASAAGPGASRKNANRTSIAPTPGQTDEYAAIIMQSRNAKMQKWKAPNDTPWGSLPSGPSLGSPMKMRTRSNIPAFDANADSEADITSADQPGDTFELSGNKEVEWVDWLDEYRKMKEAKVRAEQQHQEALDAEMMPPPPLPMGKGKGKARDTGSLSGSVGSTSSQPFAGDLSTSYNEARRKFETEELAPLEHTASLSASLNDYRPLSRTSSAKKRKGERGAFAKIDAWWGAVRHSFAQNRTQSADAVERPRTLTRSPSKLSLKLADFREDMPPPPLPLRRSRSRPNVVSGPSYGLSPVPGGNTSGSSTSSLHQQQHEIPAAIVAKGSLAPAAHISRPHLKPRTPSSRSQESNDSDREQPESAAHKRRNPHLSLNLEPRPAFMPPHLRGSHGSYHTPPRPSAGRHEPTPSLTPGHSPNWERTPAPLATSSVLYGGNTVVPVTSRYSDPNNASSLAFNMANIQQHIRQRLQGSKESCDKELRKITQGITVYVDQEIKRERDAFASAQLAEGELSRQSTEQEVIDTGTDTEMAGLTHEGHDSDLAFSNTSTRPTSALGHYHESFVDSPARAPMPPPISPSGNSASSSPMSGNVPLPRRSSLKSNPAGRGRSKVSGNSSPRRLSTHATKRYSSGLRPADLSAALMRTMSQENVESTGSSRSTSRSRSPMPPTKGSGTLSGRRSSGHATPITRQASESANSPFVAILQDIIMVATEVLDTPVSALTSKPGLCVEFIHRVQKIGKAWDENPEWPCRGWYVQLLLAIAGLSRVVEWWEAEKGFWKFNEAGETEDGTEELTFVTKPLQEDEYSGLRSRAPSAVFPAYDPMSSPQTLDLGEQMQLDSLQQAAKLSVNAPDAAGGSTSDLKMAVEEIRSATILVELSLDLGDPVFHYISPVWEQVVGLDPVSCLGVPISSLLFPGDSSLFAEATRQLVADDSHTVEIQFRLRVQPTENEQSGDISTSDEVYETMEGKGMLMHDRDTGQATHTMWVIRPIPLDSLSGRARFGRADHQRSVSDPVTPFPYGNQTFSSETALCRICERQIPAWFFEKHNETCVETHRLELDLSECNERLADMEREVHALLAALEKQSPSSPLEYRGNSLLSIQATQEKAQHVLARKLQTKLLEHVLAHVQTARSISTPALSSDSDDEQNGPIETQRLLTPTSEAKASTVVAWTKPITEDPALSQLIDDVDECARDKVATLNRLRNTIIYSERIRQEWEMRASSAILASVEEQSDAASTSLSRSQSQTAEESGQRSAVKGLGFGLGSFRSEEFGGHGTPGNLVMAEEDPTITSATESLSRFSIGKSPSLGGLTPGPLSLPQMPAHSVPVGLDVAPSLQASPIVSPQPLPVDLARRPSMSTSPLLGSVPLSPRLPSAIPSTRAKPSSIKDFEIIKPISKGAFGSVYLAKKKTTGDYYAIKVLKKSDMVAKNQVTNVRSERTILMLASGGDTDFVVKLFYTFQSPEYLYLVMEYLNGGDCAALIKALGCLEEDWARSYIAEVVLGVEQLHKRGIVHRDLKPDNLLIDAKGHLKLTDFGLSKIGLLGRQSTRSHLANFHPRRGPRSEASTPSENLGSMGFASSASQRNSYFPAHGEGDAHSESSGSDALLHQHRLSSAAGLELSTGSSLGPITQKFAQGTPDYLAPESILGLGSAEGVDWWAVGVITYEFLYGLPPFHAETPDLVFDNILSRRIDWHLEEFSDISPEAHDFMDRLMCTDPEKRLGAHGAQEVKNHPFLKNVDWTNVRKGEAAFVPVNTDPENTDYFDSRGAVAQNFDDQVPPSKSDSPAPIEQPAPSQQPPKSDRESSPINTASLSALQVPKGTAKRERSETAPPFPFQDTADDFGMFNFKNLDVLKQANQEVIKRLRSEQSHGPLVPPFGATGKRSASVSVDPRAMLLDSPPTGSTDSSASTPSRLGAPWNSHARRPSEILPKVGGGSPSSFPQDLEQHSARRNSLPSRLRAASYAFPGDTSQIYSSLQSEAGSSFTPSPPARASLPLSEKSEAPVAQVKTVDVLVAEDNPISSKVLETILVRLGCRCVVVHNGEEVVRCTMGELVFDVIFMDMLMPILDGESAARMIKSTNNVNQCTPIVAVTSYELSSPDAPLNENNTMFSAILQKPVSKDAVVNVLRKLGFQAFKLQGQPPSQQGSPKHLLSPQHTFRSPPQGM